MFFVFVTGEERVDGEVEPAEMERLELELCRRGTGRRGEALQASDMSIRDVEATFCPSEDMQRAVRRMM